MTSFKWLSSFLLAANLIFACLAETHCPGNAASVPFRLVNRHQMIVGVSVNHSGPYNFLLDTGMQITAVDLSVANELHLQPQGTAAIAGAGFSRSVSIAHLDSLEAGSQAVADSKVLVYDLGKLHVQGILGEDFLERFDVLIDNIHSLLCLDDSGAMRAEVHGPHTALATPAKIEDGFGLSNLIIVEARLSDATRTVRLLLDSGANGAILYNASEYLNVPRTGHLQGASADGGQRVFLVLPPQDVKIGSLELSGVPFFSLHGTQKDARAKGFDGVLTLGLFKRVFIARADHFAVLEPR
jgi:hypothetical protein